VIVSGPWTFLYSFPNVSGGNIPNMPVTSSGALKRRRRAMELGLRSQSAYLAAKYRACLACEITYREI
jgi:hypothetical protein